SSFDSPYWVSATCRFGSTARSWRVVWSAPAWPGHFSGGCRRSSPTMNNPAASRGRPAVRLRSLAKIYRLYQKPLYRFIDLFGLCPPSPAYYTEHTALADVD